MPQVEQEVSGKSRGRFTSWIPPVHTLKRAAAPTNTVPRGTELTELTDDLLQLMGEHTAT